MTSICRRYWWSAGTSEKEATAGATITRSVARTARVRNAPRVATLRERPGCRTFEARSFMRTSMVDAECRWSLRESFAATDRRHAVREPEYTFKTGSRPVWRVLREHRRHHLRLLEHAVHRPAERRFRRGLERTPGGPPAGGRGLRRHHDSREAR